MDNFLFLTRRPKSVMAFEEAGINEGKEMTSVIDSIDALLKLGVIRVTVRLPRDTRLEVEEDLNSKKA